MHLTKIISFALVVITGAGYAQANGSIRVTVFDESQAPVSGAWVTAHHAGEFEDMWPGSCRTGTDGSCTMRIQGPGHFALEASKIVAKYPPKTPFYLGNSFKEDVVELAQSDSSTSAVLHVGPKAGVIYAKVFDVTSGKAIVGSAELHWVSNPGIWMETGISEIGGPVLIPANVPVTLVVSREGYEPWIYKSPSHPAQKFIQLRSGEALTLHIRLRPHHRS